MSNGSGPRERTVYLNGDYLPESRAALSFRDTGFVYGDAVFDTARTFGGVPFRLDAHIERLYRTLAYARIDPGLSPAEMTAATEAMLAANVPLLGPDEDYWVTQRISSGLQRIEGEPPAYSGPTVLIECTPLPFARRARFFRDGIDAAVPTRRRIAPEALNPNAKTNNYLNMMLAQREVDAEAPGAWALLCDREGNLAEGAGCNLFLVRGGVLLTPRLDYVLAGITRDVVLGLAADAGIAVEERDLPPAEGAAADEGFFTSTSLCLCPLRSLDGRVFPAGVPGPVTRRLMDAFKTLVGHDFEAQYLRHADGAEAVVGI